MNNHRVLVILRNWIFILLSASSDRVLGIVGRDLVLTPHQGLQLTGKRIYYEQDSNEVLTNSSVYPWERTLKHVTFVTLFTDAAARAVAGNISNLKEYSDFLQSPYIRKENANFIRFGDIVMLASGRLEQNGKQSFQFIEGICGYDCAPERVWALWQVQKIRHRDRNQNFRYEMRFSVSPLRIPEKQKESENEEKIDEQSSYGGMYVRPNALKTYIQKDDDYPLSFGSIIYPDENIFAQRRQDQESAGRNFRQINKNIDYRQVTPIPQSTFMRGIFQMPSPGVPKVPPLTERLNIGEYVKNYGHPQASPKIELFPHMYKGLVNRNSFPQPTTFRPVYPIKIPRPEIYPPMQDFIKFPEEQSKLQVPAFTHHFHHHYFMPGKGDNGDGNNYGENRVTSDEFQNDIHRQVTPNFGGATFEATTTPLAPQKISFPIHRFSEHIVEVTPPTMLRKPQLFTMHPNQHARAKVPSIFYAIPTAHGAVQQHDTTHATTKPFVQSEVITDGFRYSEPDPLYANEVNNESGATHYDRPGLIEAQLLPPEKGQDASGHYSDESAEKESEEKSDLELSRSQKAVHISTQKPFLDEVLITEKPQITSEVNVSNSTNLPNSQTTSIPTTTETANVKTFTSDNNFISISTTESALRTISRPRTGRPSTTAEPALQKWKLKRRNQHSQVKYNSKKVKNEEFLKNNNNLQYKQKDDFVPSATPATNTSPNANIKNETTTSALPILLQMNDASEVLTQKSVSKSVSIKIGSNGEEIPIIINDDVVTNEVRGE